MATFKVSPETSFGPKLSPKENGKFKMKDLKKAEENEESMGIQQIHLQRVARANLLMSTNLLRRPGELFDSYLRDDLHSRLKFAFAGSSFLLLLLLLLPNIVTLASSNTSLPLTPTGSHNQAQGIPSNHQVDIEAALISSKGTLAFWRHFDISPDGPKQESGQSNSQWSRRFQNYSIDSKCLGAGLHTRPQVSNKLFTPHIVPGGLARAKARQDVIDKEDEILAVEGSSLKLNFVIVGFLESELASRQTRAQNKLQIHWTLNGNLIQVNSPISRSRFSHLIINESDLVRQYLGSPQANTSRDTQHHSYLSSMNPKSSTTTHSGQRLSELMDSFRLSPHIETNALNRLLEQADSQSLQVDLRRLLGSLSSDASKSQDDFLAEGLSIDWQKLEKYIHLNEVYLGLNLPKLSPTGGSQSSQASTQCLELQSLPLEQITVVQLEISHLNLADRGLYKLHICDTDGGDGGLPERQCPKSSFRIHVVEDLPRLLADEDKEPHVLRVGDKLSVKCEATGFTLPQISWFLDNQQLNDHQQLLQSQSRAIGDSDSGEQQDSALVLSSRLRIGDYVSQDNRVHSFVNATEVHLSDGGFYRCVANNGYHSVERQHRVHVRGPPVIARHLLNISTLIGAEQLHIQCPYSGYPIAQIEWYFRPSDGGHIASDNNQLTRGLRAKRMPSSQRLNILYPLDTVSDLVDGENPETDPEKDEWLAQASAMTPSGPEDYQEPIPEYPSYANNDQDNNDDERDSEISHPLDDYSDIQMSYQQSTGDYPVRRRRSTDETTKTGGWMKLPQSRRHQVQLNGTLIIRDVGRADEGYYRCRVLQSRQVSDSDLIQAKRFDPNELGYEIEGEYLVASSNEMQLRVQVPPVISPIISAESLREGMRNFLTCSVIEGDSPVRLHWLKDDRPIEEHIGRQSESLEGQQVARMRVDATNEFTSTLYFSHVGFQDNGNYTCVATNKAAATRYTTRMLVNVPPKWIRTPKDLDCVAGQSITIDCQARAFPNPRIWWEIGTYTSSDSKELPNQKSQVQIAVNSIEPSGGQVQTARDSHAPNHYRTIISNSRIHILENASLVIREVTKADQGYYLCQAANNFGQLSALIKLTVNVGASFSSKYLIKYAKVNERIELDCDPIGQAPVSITFFMRHLTPSTTTSSILTTMTPTLTSTNYLRANKSGQLNQYIGHYENSIHSLQNQSSQLLEPEASDPSASRSSTSFGQPANLGRRLFTANIRTSYQQSGNNMLVPAQDLQQQSYDLNHDLGISFQLLRRSDTRSEIVRLVIKQAKRIHSAEFTCLAANEFGADEKLIKLLVQEAPDPVKDISVTRFDSRSVSLVWIPPFNGHSPITSYTIEWTQLDESSSQPNNQLVVQQPIATISPMEPLTKYQINIRAHNQFGQSALPAESSSLIVTTIEEAPTAPPSDIKALPLSSTSLQLTWQPPNHSVDTKSHSSHKKFSVKGYYLGYKMSNSNESFIFKTVALPDGNSPVISNVEPNKNQTVDYSNQPDASKLIRVIINDLKKATKYSIIVQAFNSAGPGPQSDIIETKTLLNDPPPAAYLKVGIVTYTSIELQWSFANEIADMTPDSRKQTPDQLISAKLDTSENPSIEGYRLYYRPSTLSDWQERKLTRETHAVVSNNHLNDDLQFVDRNPTLNDEKFKSTPNWYKNSTGPRTYRYVLDQLTCGSSYQIYLIAFNSIGSGLPSQVIRTKTRGSVPIAPRRQEFIRQNSTHAILNLDSWMDAGCSIRNFEIRYKQLSNRAEITAGNNVQWLTLSNSINPDQQHVELPDLKPESWYLVWVSAQSAAGDTETQYAFMTLDQFGQMPTEAIEALSTSPNNNNLSALFRSNGSIRSMLNNLNSTFSGFTPLLLSTCICLLLFAMCSMFLIRRYNNILKDTASIDSRTTNSQMNSHNLLHNGDLGNYRHTRDQNGIADHMNLNGHRKQLSMGYSPCKTTSTTVLTSGPTSANSGSASHMMSASGTMKHSYNHCDQHQANCAEPIAASPLDQGGFYTQPPATLESSYPLAHKFSTLSRNEPLASVSEVPVNRIPCQISRFKTLPHNVQRPVSTFLANNQQQSLDDYHQQAEQQQIYSKLRLIYNSNHNYNACQENLKNPGSDSGIGMELSCSGYNTAYDVNNASICNVDQVQFSEYSQHKPVTCINDINRQMDNEKNPYASNGERLINQINAAAANQANETFASILMQCQPQVQDQLMTGNDAGGYQSYPRDQTQPDAGKDQHQGLVGANSSYTEAYGQSSGASSSQSAANSTQQTLSTSLSADQQVNSPTNNHTPDSIFNAPDFKANQINLVKGIANLPAAGQAQGQPHSDYALPFPPKWV